MRFGIFYEHQLPRPWTDGSEAQLLLDALEQVELADRLGIDYVWEVEHHFLEEYSHSSAPEVFLAAASQRTRRIRLGHGIVNVMPAVNHPARVAERIATLDLISQGRVDFGTGESSSAAELGGFLVDRERKREMWQEEVDAITRMLVEEPFTGMDGEFVQMPPRNVIPKPLQKPHPPVWVACSRRETIHLAARNGIGAPVVLVRRARGRGKMGPRVLRADRLARMRARRLRRQPPRGDRAADDAGLEDEADAIERGYRRRALLRLFARPLLRARRRTTSASRTCGTNSSSAALSPPASRTPHRHARTRRPSASGSCRRGARCLLRGAIGTPAQVSDLVRRYDEAGVDQVIFVLVSGPESPRAHSASQLRLFAGEGDAGVRRGPRRARGGQGCGGWPGRSRRRSGAASHRARTDSAPYVIDEQAELAGAGQRGARRRRRGARELSDLALEEARQATRETAMKVLGRLVDGAGDAQVEERRSRLRIEAQRAIFAGMARSFEPEAAGGFQGSLVYELARPATDAEAMMWTIEVADGHATARPGDSDDAALSSTIRFNDGRLRPNRGRRDARPRPSR